MITNVNSFAYYLFMQISVHHVLSTNRDARNALSQTLANRGKTTQEFIDQFKQAHRIISSELKPLINNYIQQLKSRGQQKPLQSFDQILSMLSIDNQKVVPESISNLAKFSIEILNKMPTWNIEALPTDGSSKNAHHEAHPQMNHNILHSMGKSTWINVLRDRVTGMIVGSTWEHAYIKNMHRCTFGLEIVKNNETGQFESKELHPISDTNRAAQGMMIDALTNVHKHFLEITDLRDDEASQRIKYMLTQLIISTSYHESWQHCVSINEITQQYAMLQQDESVGFFLAILKSTNILNNEHLSSFINGYRNAQQAHQETTVSLARLWHQDSITDEQKPRLLCDALVSNRSLTQICDATGLNIIQIASQLDTPVLSQYTNYASASEFFSLRVKSLFRLKTEANPVQFIQKLKRFGETLDADQTSNEERLATLKQILLESSTMIINEDIQPNHIAQLHLPIEWSIMLHELTLDKEITLNFSPASCHTQHKMNKEQLNRFFDSNQLLLLGLHPTHRLTNSNHRAQPMDSSHEPDDSLLHYKAILSGLFMNLLGNDPDKVCRAIDLSNACYTLLAQHGYNRPTEAAQGQSLIIHFVDCISEFQQDQETAPHIGHTLLYALLKSVIQINLNAQDFRGMIHQLDFSTPSPHIQAIRTRRQHKTDHWSAHYIASIATEDITQDKIINLVNRLYSTALDQTAAIEQDEQPRQQPQYLAPLVNALDTLTQHRHGNITETLLQLPFDSDEEKQSVAAIYKQLISQSQTSTQPSLVQSLLRNHYWLSRHHLNQGQAINLQACLLASLTCQTQPTNFKALSTSYDFFSDILTTYFNTPTSSSPSSILPIMQYWQKISHECPNSTLTEKALLTLASYLFSITPDEVKHYTPYIKKICRRTVDTTEQPIHTNNNLKILFETMVRIMAENPNKPTLLTEKIFHWFEQNNFYDRTQEGRDKAYRQAEFLAKGVRQQGMNGVTKSLSLAANQVVNDAINILTNRIVCAFLAHTFVTYYLILKTSGYFAQLSMFSAISHFLTISCVSILGLWGLYTVFKNFFVSPFKFDFDFEQMSLDPTHANDLKQGPETPGILEEGGLITPNKTLIQTL